MLQSETKKHCLQQGVCDSGGSVLR